jgi:hypothetical protein
MPEVHVELDPPAARPKAVCSIHGTDRPFDTTCGSTLTIASEARAVTPMVLYEPHGVDVTFDIAKESGPAAIRVVAGGVTVSGFSDISALSFHLSQEATAFKGHVHLLAGDPVTVGRATEKGVIVRTQGDRFDVEDIDAEASCNALLFDGFHGSPTVPSPVKGTSMLTKESFLRLKGDAGEAPFFVLRIPRDRPPLAVTQIGSKGTDAHISFATQKARFDAWVSQDEIDYPSHGFGVGSGTIGCGRSQKTPLEADFQVIDDTDVLVASAPGKRGPSGVRLSKGIFVVAHEAHGGWAEISIEPPVISPAAGLHFFVPWGALRDT